VELKIPVKFTKKTTKYKNKMLKTKKRDKNKKCKIRFFTYIWKQVASKSKHIQLTIFSSAELITKTAQIMSVSLSVY